jgi:hypothetical protein
MYIGKVKFPKNKKGNAEEYERLLMDFCKAHELEFISRRKKRNSDQLRDNKEVYGNILLMVLHLKKVS